MGFFKDSFAMFTNHSLPFKYHTQETDDVYTFHFEKPEKLKYEAGQYGLFKINHEVLKNKTKPFTISSSPNEDTISITTRIGDPPSPYKRALMNLHTTHSLSFKGPVGSLNETKSSEHIYIAGGMGITPFRSMLKDASISGSQTDITLIYFTNDTEPVFKEELDAFQKNGLVSVFYKNYDDFKTLETYLSEKSGSEYLIAGSEQFVNSTLSFLISKGVQKKQIKKDILYGY